MPTAPVTTTSDAKVEAQVFWIRFHKEILAAVVLLILGSIGYAGYRFYSQHQVDTAADLLGAAKKPQDYQQVIAQYPNTPAGASASLFLAESQRAEKNFEGANTTLKEFIAKHPKHELVSTARVAMAGNLESMGKADDALMMYQSAVVNDPKGFSAPLALMSQVRLLKAKKQTEEARRVCERVIAEHSDSFWVGEAMRELRELKPPAPPMTPPVAGPAAPPLIARPPTASAPVVPSASPAAKKKK